MQSISIDHPAVKASLNSLYMTTKEAAEVLRCSTRKITQYASVADGVLRRKGKGKVMVNAYDVYSAVSEDGKGDRLNELAKAKLNIYQIPMEAYAQLEEVMSCGDGELSMVEIEIDDVMMVFDGCYRWINCYEADTNHQGRKGVSVSLTCETYKPNEFDSEGECIVVRNNYCDRSLELFLEG